MMAKLSREHAERHAVEVSRCLKMCEALSVPKCSLRRGGGLTDIASCTACTHDRSPLVTGSFTLKRLPTLKEENANTRFASLHY